jgi:antirestriction protein ArdC
MGAAFLCVTCGIPYATRHSNYIGNWIQVLKDHKRAIFSAAAKAQGAMDFVLKTDFEESGSAEPTQDPATGAGKSAA